MLSLLPFFYIRISLKKMLVNQGTQCDFDVIDNLFLFDSHVLVTFFHSLSLSSFIGLVLAAQTCTVTTIKHSTKDRRINRLWLSVT